MLGVDKVSKKTFKDIEELLKLRDSYTEIKRAYDNL